MLLRYRCKRRNHQAGRRGAAVVELAILLPLLLFLFVLAIDWARIFYFSLTLQNCARNGALYGSDAVAADSSPYKSIQEAALADSKSLPSAPSVTHASGTDGDGNGYVEVTTSYTFRTFANYPGIPRETVLRRTVRMRTAPVVPNTP